MEIVESNFATMQSIALDELNTLALFDRVDKKFVLKRAQLDRFMEYILDNEYKILRVNNLSIQQYETHYMDTPDFRFYLEHHNQRANRLKIRMRTYTNSGLSFLEIKRRVNTGETQKKRILQSESKCLNEESCAFIRKYAEIDPLLLQPTAITNFNRITFISEKFQERLTLDFNLNFAHRNKSTSINDSYILEVKKEKGAVAGGAIYFLKQHSIKSLGISKYCLTIAVLNNEIKHNYFKPLILKLNFTPHGNLY
jgi:VTC domain.